MCNFQNPESIKNSSEYGGTNVGTHIDRNVNIQNLWFLLSFSNKPHGDKAFYIAKIRKKNESQREHGFGIEYHFDILDFEVHLIL